MNRSLLFTALLCALWVRTAAAAENPSVPAGIVKRVSGQVLLDRADRVGQPLAVGQQVQAGDVVRTGPDGATGITLADDTLLTAGPDSQLVIDRFAFDSTTHDGNLLLKLWRGTLHVVTGLIARRAPENVQVQTRTVVLGVRGTEFIVDAGKGQP